MSARDKLVERSCRLPEVTTDERPIGETRPADRPARDYGQNAEDNPAVAKSLRGKPNLAAWLRYLDA
jgi:hypothetical protein